MIIDKLNHYYLGAQVIAMPEHANSHTKVFGGWLVSQCDLAGCAVVRQLMENGQLFAMPPRAPFDPDKNRDRQAQGDPHGMSPLRGDLEGLISVPTLPGNDRYEPHRLIFCMKLHWVAERG